MLGGGARPQAVQAEGVPVQRHKPLQALQNAPEGSECLVRLPVFHEPLHVLSQHGGAHEQEARGEVVFLHLRPRGRVVLRRLSGVCLHL